MNNLPHYVFIVDDNACLNMPPKEGDVGYDVYAYSPPTIIGQIDSEGFWDRVDYIEYDLSIKIDGFQAINSPLEDIYTLVFPRSSISKYNLLLANSVGVIDSGYRGSLKVRFKYIFQPEDLSFSKEGKIKGVVNMDKIYNEGDKVCQLVFQKHFHPTIEFTSSIEDSERGGGGFGSTGV